MVPASAWLAIIILLSGKLSSGSSVSMVGHHHPSVWRVVQWFQRQHGWPSSSLCLESYPVVPASAWLAIIILLCGELSSGSSVSMVGHHHPSVWRVVQWFQRQHGWPSSSFCLESYPVVPASAWLAIIILLCGELSSGSSVSMVGHHHPSVWRVVQWSQRQHGWPPSSFCLEIYPVVPASAWLATIILLSGDLSSGSSVSMVGHHHPSVWRVIQWFQRQHGWPPSSFCLESYPVVPASAWLAIIILLSGKLSSGSSVSMVGHHHPSVWRVIQWFQRQHGWPSSSFCLESCPVVPASAWLATIILLCGELSSGPSVSMVGHHHPSVWRVIQWFQRQHGWPSSSFCLESCPVVPASAWLATIILLSGELSSGPSVSMVGHNHPSVWRVVQWSQRQHGWPSSSFCLESYPVVPASAWLGIIILLSGELSSGSSVSMVGHHHPSVWKVIQWFQRQHGWPSSSFCVESCPVVPASAWLAIIILLSGELSSGSSVSMVGHHHPSVWRVIQWFQRQHGWPSSSFCLESCPVVPASAWLATIILLSGELSSGSSVKTPLYVPLLNRMQLATPRRSTRTRIRFASRTVSMVPSPFLSFCMESDTTFALPSDLNYTKKFIYENQSVNKV